MLESDQSTVVSDFTGSAETDPDETRVGEATARHEKFEHGHLRGGVWADGQAVRVQAVTRERAHARVGLRWLEVNPEPVATTPEQG